MRKSLATALALALAVFGSCGGAFAKAPLVESYLIEGRLNDGEARLQTQLKTHEKDDQARFGLGMLQFLQAVQGLFQDLARYSIRNYSDLNLNVHLFSPPESSEAKRERITYEKWRLIFEKLESNLRKADATLGGITDAKVKLPLHFGLIRLDLNGDGLATEKELLWKLYVGLQGRGSAAITEERASDFFVNFDRGDVHWLRGYCNVFLTICDIYLAYDSRDTFDRSAQLLFTDPITPYQPLSKPRARGKSIHDVEIRDALDAVAVIHSIHWKLVEPGRMESALHHLETIVSESRVSWKFILAETDDDHEWLPNPTQTGVIPGVRVSKAMVSSWSEIMNESERILQGRLLLPWWRGETDEGINLRRVFLQPRDFDLIFCVQGSDLLAYVEKGESTKLASWETLSRDFGGHFPGFAAWFN